jgi:hypothetical protein
MIRKITVTSLTGLLAAILLSVVALAQAAKRIDFAQSPSLVWEEKVAAHSSKSFVFYAKKGQQLTLSMIDDTNQGAMDLGKISIEPNTSEPFKMVIEVTKDYTLSVSNHSNKATSFRIFITLEGGGSAARTSTPATTDPNSVRVQFARGESSVSLTKTIAANGSLDFLINAKQGQTMSFTVGYDFKDSDVRVVLIEPGRQDGSLQSGPKKPNEFRLRKTGDHRLTVTNTTRKKITITLYLDIN